MREADAAIDRRGTETPESRLRPEAWTRQLEANQMSPHGSRITGSAQKAFLSRREKRIPERGHWLLWPVQDCLSNKFQPRTSRYCLRLQVHARSTVQAMKSEQPKLRSIPQSAVFSWSFPSQDFIMATESHSRSNATDRATALMAASGGERAKKMQRVRSIAHRRTRTRCVPGDDFPGRKTGLPPFRI